VPNESKKFPKKAQNLASDNTKPEVDCARTKKNNGQHATNRDDDKSPNVTIMPVEKHIRPMNRAKDQGKTFPVRR
jgi:hypothetical protein